MADQTILQETLDNNIVDGDWLIYWKTSTGVQRRVARSALLGATLTGSGTIATGGFTLTVPATGTAALKTGTPTAGQVAQWDDANTVESAGFAASDVARLSQTNTFTAVNTFSSIPVFSTGVQITSGDVISSNVGTPNDNDKFYVGLLGEVAGIHFRRQGAFDDGSIRFVIQDEGVVTEALKVENISNASSGTRVVVSSLSGVGNRAVYSDANGVLTNSSSDASMKTAITAIEAGDALRLVHALRPVRYRWNEETAERLGEQTEVGLIAQEVEPHVPEVIGSNPDGTLSIDYAKLTALLIGAVQALTARVEALEAAAA
jgi:hypothetical protein